MEYVAMRLYGRCFVPGIPMYAPLGEWHVACPSPWPLGISLAREFEISHLQGVG